MRRVSTGRRGIRCASVLTLLSTLCLLALGHGALISAPNDAEATAGPISTAAKIKHVLETMRFDPSLFAAAESNGEQSVDTLPAQYPSRQLKSLQESPATPATTSTQSGHSQSESVLPEPSASAAAVRSDADAAPKQRPRMPRLPFASSSFGDSDSAGTERTEAAGQSKSIHLGVTRHVHVHKHRRHTRTHPDSSHSRTRSPDASASPSAPASAPESNDNVEIEIQTLSRDELANYKPAARALSSGSLRPGRGAPTLAEEGADEQAREGTEGEERVAALLAEVPTQTLPVSLSGSEPAAPPNKPEERSRHDVQRAHRHPTPTVCSFSPLLAWFCLRVHPADACLLSREQRGAGGAGGRRGNSSEEDETLEYHLVDHFSVIYMGTLHFGTLLPCCCLIIFVLLSVSLFASVCVCVCVLPFASLAVTHLVCACMCIYVSSQARRRARSA